MTLAKEITLAILIDSFRHDFLRKEITPYLHSLAESGVTGIIESSLAFSNDPAWFAGLSPRTSDKLCVYIYSPRILKPKIEWFIYPLGRRRFSKGIAKFTLKFLYPYVAGFAWNIPIQMYRYFDITDKFPPWHPNYLSNIPTLFKILQDNGKGWLFIGSSALTQKTTFILKKFRGAASGKETFIWLHFAELDWACHNYGQLSIQSKTKLREIDKAIERIHKYLKNRGYDVNILAFGDHGHVSVTHVFNLQKLLRRVPLRENKDYVYFLDSTMARFWFKNEKAQNEIAQILSTVNCGKILSEEDLCRYKLPTSMKHGQLIWVVNGGWIILPNFWQGTSGVAGMHGYLPEVEHNHSRFILSGPHVPRGMRMNEKRKLVDMFPTLLDLMDLPIPRTSEGLSILRACK